jgi:hypothetical protein
MPKSNQPDKNSRSLSELPRFIQIDEGIFGSRLSERITPDFIEQNLDKFLQKLKDFQLILEDKDFEEDDYEYEDFDPEEFDPKVYKILGNNNLDVNLKNQKKYLSYLKQALQNPCILTGNQEFAWEEYYILAMEPKNNMKNSAKPRRLSWMNLNSSVLVRRFLHLTGLSLR